jgi:hypothetical protein
MIAAGEVPMVDCAVFADTQGERRGLASVAREIFTR